jgi:hypothetical protein
MDLPPLVPQRWQEQPWWRPLVRGAVLAIFIPTLVLGTWYRVEAYLVAREKPLDADVQNFYEIARAMHHPYQSRHREPMQILLVKGSLMLFGDRPASALLPTLVSSVLLIAATFLFGRAVFSVPVGLAGAVLVAFNHDLIARGARGYREELFGLLILLFTYVLFAAQGWRVRRRLLLSGVVGGLLLLVRITSATLLVPALGLWAWRERRRSDRRWLPFAWAGAAFLLSLALLAPYLIECWRVFGRPLIAIDTHAQWWTEAEAGHLAKSPPEETAVSVFTYLFAPAHIGRTLVRMVQGYWLVARTLPWYGNWLFLVPFALAGAVMTAARRERYLLWVVFWVLLPFTVVMPLGGDVRFFMYLYPVYALWSAVGFYPFAFGVLYYLSGGKMQEWVGGTEVAAREVPTDGQPKDAH